MNIIHKIGNVTANNREDIGQGQRSLQTQEDVPYFSSFIAKSWLNDLEDIGQGQRSSYMTNPLMLMMICAKYGKNSS